MSDVSQMNLAYLFIGLVVSLILVLIFFKRKEKFPYFTKGTLLTSAELKFYKILKAVVQNRYDISCKVRLADIISCTDYYWHKGYGPKISAKHIDFVLQNPQTSDILLCIELDDKSHQRPDRIKRDKFLNQALETATVPLLRIPVAKGYDLARLEKDIAVAIK
jgi:LPXTG-motif cell wall-anchored protein